MGIYDKAYEYEFYVRHIFGNETVIGTRTCKSPATTKLWKLLETASYRDQIALGTSPIKEYGYRRVVKINQPA